MRLMRRLLALALTALIAVPAPAWAQTIRVAVDAPLAGAPAFSAPVPFALSAPALSAPGLSPLSASFPMLPAPAISAAPVVAAPAALATAIRPAPSAPEKPAEAQKADADKRFDGSVSPEESSPVAVASAEFDRRIAALGRVSAPRPWLEKTKVVLAYGGLTAAAVGLNAPFEHIGPLIVGLIMSPMLSFMGLFFYGASQSVVPGGQAPYEHIRISPDTLAMISRLAAEAKVPEPARVRILAGDGVQAQVGARDDAGYEIRFTKGFEALRPEVKEGILRHEFAHERHHDMPWSIVNMFLAPLPIMIGLMGMDGKGPLEGLLLGAIAATSVLLFPTSLQHSEYLADQYAASKPEGAGPLARFFIEDSENPARAASALSGREFSSETGLKRRAIMAWDSIKRTFSAHPSHDRRIARLARLAEKERGR